MMNSNPGSPPSLPAAAGAVLTAPLAGPGAPALLRLDARRLQHRADQGTIGIADQLLKAWVVATFDDARPTELLGDWLRIAITQNSGALFGLFRDQAGLFALFSLTTLKLR